MNGPEMPAAEDLLSILQEGHERLTALVAELTPLQRQLPWHPGVNPPVWELGHSAFFFEYFLLMDLDGEPAEDPVLAEVWDSAVLPHSQRWSAQLFPAFDDTLSYADRIASRIKSRMIRKNIEPVAALRYSYACFHQHMHIESLIWARQTMGFPAPTPASISAPRVTDTKHEPGEQLVRPAQSGLTDGRYGLNSTERPCQNDASIPEGDWVFGMPADSPRAATSDFSFDNERPRFCRHLPAFQISRTLVTCAEFLEFVDQGGYETPAYWSRGGCLWLTESRRRPAMDLAADPPRLAEPTASPAHPAYWRKGTSGWEVRHFDTWHPLEPDFPVLHISYWEAEAWCNWAGRRLPTEYEWEVAALGNSVGSPHRRFPWGNQMDPTRVDMDARYLGRIPVTALQEGVSPSGCLQMIGTCWEWTSSIFFPYAGFCMDFYPFMSTLQFGDHHTVRGGSTATSSRLIRGTYRQAYQPDRFDVFCGFRSCPI